jgi:HxlR-like helix-turn-helix
MSSLSLSSRLWALETARIIRRAPYSERPRRFEYLVTAKGRSLWPALVALTQRGDQWASGGNIPLRIEHNDCPYRGRPTFCCSGFGEPMAEGDATTVMSMRMKKDREARGNLQAH